MSRMFQYEHDQSRIGGSLWKTPLRYIENSPIFTADKIRTPLLMMHNDEDGAVPWYQGIEYFIALRRLRKPVWLLGSLMQAAAVLGCAAAAGGLSLFEPGPDQPELQLVHPRCVRPCDWSLKLWHCVIWSRARPSVMASVGARSVPP